MLRPAARRYIAALSGAALAIALFALIRMGVPSGQQELLAIALAALVAVAWLFPLPISFKTHLYLDTSVVVAAILTLEPGLAILVAGIGTVVAHRIRHEDAAQTVFNASQAMLQAAAGAAVLSLGHWHVHHSDFGSLVMGLLILAAGITMTLVSDLAVATMVALQSGVSLPRSWSQAVIYGDPAERMTQFAQIGLGIIGAVLIATYAWTLFLLLIPSVAVYVSLARAIEHRKLAEEALRDTEAALMEAQRVAHLGSWDWNLETGDQGWSDEAFRIFGFAPKAFLPTWHIFMRCIHPDDRTRFDTAVHDALYAGERFSLDHRIVRPDGSERVVHEEGEVVFGEGGEKQRVVGTVQDITERKQAERAREALLASVSHDLKSPLTVIRGHAQLLQMKARRAGANPTELGDGLAKIDAAASRMAAQLTELLDVARLQMGEELELLREPFDLVALVRERAGVHQQTTRRHEIIVQTDRDEVSGEWDRGRLERVFDNLIGNAVKYSPAGGKVMVRVCSEHDGSGEWAVVSVADEGVGIPLSDLPHVFAPFQRGGNVGTIPGTGVGLAGARQIVEQHGGTITVESAEGRGSVFMLRLPC
ncbi:MAG TPA: ATP-binding protein [Thermomicrobiales bacterium]|nr:ATP-binding protein [Thermomicrobiales bacterium]